MWVCGKSCKWYTAAQASVERCVERAKSSWAIVLSADGQHYDMTRSGTSEEKQQVHTYSQHRLL